MSKSETLRWGVIGAGGIARRRTIPEGIIPASNAKLVSVFDPISGEEVATEFNVTACNDREQLLNSDCDAVYIATPTHLHLECILAAAQAGKHVLCEKPLGMNAAEAEQAVRACDESGVKLGVGFMMRLHPAHRVLQDLVAQGRLGQPVLGRAQLSCWFPPMEGSWRQDPAKSGGGVLMDLACHSIDLLEMMFGAVQSVCCFSDHLVHDYQSEDIAVVMLRFRNGAMGIVDALFNVPDESSLNRLELYGDAGSALAEGTIGQAATGEVILRLAEKGGYDADQQREIGTGGAMDYPDNENIYKNQIEGFSAAVLNNENVPIDGSQGLWNQKIIDACYASASRGGEPVHVK